MHASLNPLPQSIRLDLQNLCLKILASNPLHQTVDLIQTLFPCTSRFASQVQSVTETDVVCVAQNSATLEGLLTVFHVERSKGSGLSNQQARAEVYDLFRGGRGKGTTCLTWTCLLCSTWSGSSARTRKDLGWGHACLTHEKHFLE